MDWFLSVTTLLVNGNLGWSKGARWAWMIHAVNAAIWIYYAYTIHQFGLILLSFVTIAVDIVSGIRSKK